MIPLPPPQLRYGIGLGTTAKEGLPASHPEDSNNHSEMLIVSDTGAVSGLDTAEPITARSQKGWCAAFPLW